MPATVIDVPGIPDGGEYRNLPLSELKPSATNPRKHFDEKKLQELAESIKQAGVIQPLVVHPVNGHHEIVAGERRYRAATLAGVAEVPVRIVNLTPQQVLEIQVIENDQREDVHPLEQAAGYAALMASGGYDVDALALKTGKPPAFIAQRLSFNKLIAPAKDAFAEGKIGIGHALLIARLQPSDQADALSQCWRRDNMRVPGKLGGFEWKDVHVQTPVKTLEMWIQQEILLSLKSAPFDVKDAELLPKAGACSSCSKRSGAMMALFPELKDKNVCTDKGCYEAKCEAAFQHTLAAAKKEHGSVLLLSPEWNKPYGQTAPKDVLYRTSYEQIEAKKGRCAFSEHGILVDGPQKGTVIEVCRDPHCPKHKGKHKGFDNEESAIATKYKEKATDLKRQQEIAFRKALLGQVKAIVDGMALDKLLHTTVLKAIAHTFVQRLDSESTKRLAQVMGFDAAKKDDRGYTYTSWSAPLVAFIDEPTTGAEGILRLLVAGALQTDVYVPTWSTKAFDRDGQLHSVAQFLEVDAAALDQAAAEQFAPKWQALEKRKKAERDALKAKKVEAEPKAEPKKKAKKGKAAAAGEEGE